MGIRVKASRLQFVQLAIGLLLFTNGCGNSWMASQERKSTPSALIEEGQYAYDKRNFQTAVNFFQKAVEKDPNNQEARLKLAYSLNATAGVELYDVISGFIKFNQSGSDTAANPLKIFVDVVGLNSQEAASIVEKIKSVGYNDLQSLRNVSNKLMTLQKSWRVICRLIPADYLSKVVGTDNDLASDLEVDTSCLGGLPSKNISTGVLLVAAFGAMAQGAAFYQTALDTNNDGNIDFVVEAESLSKAIETLKTDSTTATPDAAVQKLTNLNQQLESLTSLNVKIKSRLVTMTLAQFTLLEWLIANIPGLPEAVKSQISTSIAKFGEAREKLSSYMASGQNTAGATTTATQGAGIQSRVDLASTTVNTLKDKACASSGSQQCTDFTNSLTNTCKNFDALKLAYNLSPTTQKPSGCP